MTKKDFTQKDFYVYIHSRASDGVIFYVGKGRGKRAWVFGGRSKWWTSTYEKHGVSVAIFKDGLSNTCAMTLEKILIHHYLSNGYDLVNLTLGGEGASGSVRSEETRILSSQSLGGRPVVSSDGLRFETAVMAAEWLSKNGWPRASRSNISNVCLNKSGSAYGRTWWYDGDKPKQYVDKRNKISLSRAKPVICSNGKVFDSLQDAGLWMHSQGSGAHAEKRIWKCCKGIVDSAYGLQWRYE